MRFLPLIWATLWRKRARTLLTLLSIVVAFVLFGVMHGVPAAVDAALAQMSDTRLRIQSRVSLTQPLPLAHLPRIESLDGVEGVAYASFFVGYFREPANQMAASAIDMERLDAMFGDSVEVDPEPLAAMRTTPNGAIIGEELAAERGWRIGDTVPLSSSVWTRRDGSMDWSFEIVGTYRRTEGSLPSNEFWMNYDYFDEARAFANGTVSMFFARITDPDRAAGVSERIDALFANSTFETQTQNERDWMRARIDRIGDIEFFVTAVNAAVLFTLLFLTGNTMMQSVRERTPELAVLKTYGYGNGIVLTLVLAEAVLLCLFAALVGLAIAAALFPGLLVAMGAGRLPLPGNVVGVGAGVALVLALASALPPALRAQRLNVVDALSGR